MSEVEFVPMFELRHYMCKHVNSTRFEYIADAPNRNGTPADLFREASHNYEGAKMAMQKAVDKEINWN